MNDSLAFLSADMGAADGPVARSPLARSAEAAGARTEVRDGWEVAVSYAEGDAEALACRESVGFGDRSQLGKLELQGPASALDALAAMPALDGGLATRAENAWWCRLTPESALVLCEPAATAALREHLGAAFAGHLLDVTATFGAFALVGPLALETFARFCALDLRPQVTPIQGLRPGSVARTPGLVLREDEQRYLTVFGAAYGDYVWEVVADAAIHLGGRPVGADALVASASASAAIEGAGSHA